MRLTAGEIVTSAGVRIARAFCHVRSDDVAELPVDQLEETLTVAAMEAATALDTDATILWANRTHLSESETSLDGWIMHPDRAETLPIPTADRARALVGWGNNTVFRSSEWSVAEIDAYVFGLTDAQALWARLERLSNAVHDDLMALIASSRNPRTKGSYLDSARRFRVDLAFQNAMYDELITGIQGPRRLVAEGVLTSWGYETAFERVDSRICDVEGIAHNHSELLRRRYQVGVEVLLYGLGGLTIVQTALDFVGTAYSNMEDSPGGDVPAISVLDALRHGSVDGFLAVVMGITLIAIAYLIHAGRRGISGG